MFADASRTLSIVVPAYNEELRLQPTMEETMTYDLLTALVIVQLNN